LDSGKDAARDVKNEGRKALDSGKDAARDVKKEGQEALDSGKDKARDVSRDVKKEGQKALDSGKDAAKDVKKEGGKALEEGKEKAKDALERGKEKVKETSKDIKKEGENTLEKGKQLVRQVSQGSGQLWDQTKQKATDAYVETKDTLSEVSDRVGGSLKESYGSLVGDKSLEKDGKNQRKRGAEELNKRWSRSYSERDLRKEKRSRDDDEEEEDERSSRGQKGRSNNRKGHDDERRRSRKQHNDYDFEPTPLAGYTDKFVGTLKEGVGKLVGADDWVEDGERQKERGDAELEAAYKKESKKSKKDHK